jgi:hypothetical protein
MRSDDAFEQLMAQHPRLFHGGRPLGNCQLPRGWFPLVNRLCDELEQLLGEEIGRFKVRQVKEKLGTLRFYWGLPARHADAKETRLEVSPLAEALSERIRAAELESSRICEVCGGPGQLTAEKGTLTTRCRDHSSVDPPGSVGASGHQI